MGGVNIRGDEPNDGVDGVRGPPSQLDEHPNPKGPKSTDTVQSMICVVKSSRIVGVLSHYIGTWDPLGKVRGTPQGFDKASANLHTLHLPKLPLLAKSS